MKHEVLWALRPTLGNTVVLNTRFSGRAYLIGNTIVLTTRFSGCYPISVDIPLELEAALLLLYDGREMESYLSTTYWSESTIIAMIM